MNEMHTIKELEALLLRELAQELTTFKFKPRLRQQEFFIDTGSAERVVHVGFIRHKIDIDATLDIGVLLPAVEKVLKNGGWIGSGSATIGAEIGNVVDGRPRRWAIRTELDAIRVASEMATVFATFGVGWLEKFSNLEVVFDELATNDRHSWLLMPLHAKRCAIVVTLAILLRSGEEASTIANDCQTFLAARKDPQLEAFIKYAELLLAR